MSEQEPKIAAGVAHDDTRRRVCHAHDLVHNDNHDEKDKGESKQTQETTTTGRQEGHERNRQEGRRQANPDQDE